MNPLEDINLSLDDIKKSKNVAELLDEEQLSFIAKTVSEGYEIDEDSRAEWKSIVDKAMEIAKQITSKKNFPWPGASNIKMPIITRACIDYASRTLPEIIQNDRVVKCAIVGNEYDAPPTNDPQQAALQQQVLRMKNKQDRASRVSKFMSYQLLHKSPDWENGVDSLLQTLPVLGTVFKKTYYSETEKRIISDMCVPSKIVVNYNATSLETARRVTHILTMYSNDILERQRRGIFSEVDLDTLKNQDEFLTSADSTDGTYSADNDYDFPIEVLEQHCYFDLDGDGYKEPYVVLIHKATKQVLRIVNRFKSIEKVKGKVAKIEPEQYFTDFHFIKSPDGGFYSMGFGSLLLPMNTAINTLINQLIDAGTLSNTQGGFLGRGLRLKNGEFKIKMGEWKVLDASSGTKIGDNVYPLPVREPSQTLFQLLGLMIQMSQDLSSTTDVLSGKQPAQNVSSNTISQLVEQGTKVFTAVNKRVYRGLKKEYQKIYELNYYHLKQDEYRKVLDNPIANVKRDFELDSIDILPVADPTLSSDQQRLQRASIVQQLPTVDRRAADEMILDAIQLDAAKKRELLPPPDPNAPPPPEAQKIMAEVQRLQAEIAKISAEATLQAEQVSMDKVKSAQDMKESESRINESIARAWKMQEDALVNRKKIEITQGKMQYEEEIKGADLINKINQDRHDNVKEDVELIHKIEKENKELDLQAEKATDDILVEAAKLSSGEKKEATKAQAKSKPKAKSYSDDDIKYTALLKGMTAIEVKKLLGVEDGN